MLTHALSAVPYPLQINMRHDGCFATHAGIVSTRFGLAAKEQPPSAFLLQHVAQKCLAVLRQRHAIE
jgi:hypothetical protein